MDLVTFNNTSVSEKIKAKVPSPKMNLKTAGSMTRLQALRHSEHAHLLSNIEKQ